MLLSTSLVFGLGGLAACVGGGHFVWNMCERGSGDVRWILCGELGWKRTDLGVLVGLIMLAYVRCHSPGIYSQGFENFESSIGLVRIVWSQCIVKYTPCSCPAVLISSTKGRPTTDVMRLGVYMHNRDVNFPNLPNLPIFAQLTKIANGATGQFVPIDQAPN